MDTFNSKEFYGHSLTNDPKLRTTTRNYEFKYNSSDHLEKVISQVRMNRDMKKEKEFLTRTRVLPSIAKLLAPYPSHEKIPEIKMPKVETHIGRSSSRETVVKVMSDADIHAMVSRALLSSPSLAPINEPPETSSLIDMSSEDNLEIMEPKVIFSARKPEIQRKAAIYCAENQSTIQPKWVEIEPNQKAFSSMTLVTSKQLTESQSDESLSMPDDNESHDLVDDEPNEAHQNQAWDTLSFDSKLSEDLVIRNDPDERSYRRDEEEKSPQNSVTSFGIESQLNDIEHAEMERILGKTFQKWQLPHVPEIDFDNLDNREGSESSDFEDAQEQGTGTGKNQDEVKNRKAHIQPLMSVTTTASRSTKRNSPKKNTPRRSNTGTEKSTKNTSRSIRSTASPFAPKDSTILSPSDKQMKKQIENLKQEKLRIFCKMTSIHEKSIEMLDRLRHSFTELSLPDGLAERKTRERNAFEFSVRFSRNYLFPLGRMIDELKATPAEYFNSAVTNEPCVKVCGIYGLLSQALQCYHKQLRHFFTENTPKKLDILLSMIIESSHLCFEKEIFDKRDTVIQCLLLRCNIFLEFLAKFSKDQQSARKDIETPRSARWDQARLSKTSSKWDLTMNLNNLNMYEPTVVSKPVKKVVEKKPEKKEKREKKTGQSQSSRVTLKSKEAVKARITRRENEPIVLPAPDPIDTQVQKQLPSSEGDNDLTKTVIETLQDITKDEVRQMLGPIVLNLDSILKSQDNPQTVDSMLSVLKSQLLAKCKVVDTAATENSTQNCNTYQKEVTKKRVHSNTSVEHNKESKDTRRRRSKVNTPKSRNSSRTTVKKDSTERTEKRISRGGRMDTMRDKQSLTNDDYEADDYEQQQRTRSRSAVSGEGIPSVEVAKILPTPPGEEPAAIQIGNGIPPPSLAISPSPLPVQLDEVMPLPQPIHMPTPPPPPPPIATAPSNRLTSQRLEKSSTEPEAMISLEDKFAPESDGCLKAHQWRGIDSQRQQIRDGAVNEEARRMNPPSSQTKLTGATTLTGQIKQLQYCRNAQYTFIRYNEEEYSAERTLQNELPQSQQEIEDDYIPDKEYFTESCTKLATLSAKSSQNLSFKSLQNSVPNLIPNAPPRMEEQRKNTEDVKSLLEERTSFIECCENDPFYNNPQFPEPWKVFSKISQTIASDILGNFVNDLSFGEESYVRDFIDMETKT